MSTPKKVVGQLSLAGLMVALMGCGGASEEQEVLWSRPTRDSAMALACAWASECLLMVCRSMLPPTRPVLRMR